uniref:Mutator family transposase n=1 Tax=Candidatus Methanosuratincola petrocarbonis (ex Vanwonterghem et al. 2016) TaxID=1867261 RepID=A0A7J3UZT6_9CREN
MKAGLAGAFRGHPYPLRRGRKHHEDLPLPRRNLRAFYSPQSISRLIQVTAEKVKAWRERSLSDEYYAVFVDGTFLFTRRGKTARDSVYIALGIKPDGRREILGFCISCGRGKRSE